MEQPGHREKFFPVGISYSSWIYLCPAQAVQSHKDGAAALEPAHPAAFWGAELGSPSLHKLRGKKYIQQLGLFPTLIPTFTFAFIPFH